VLEQGLTAHQLDRVLAVTLPDNQRSNHLLQLAGFVSAGVVELYGSANNYYEYTARTLVNI
jgi:RimJ/RimL family protein N-acetyltransferase